MQTPPWDDKLDAQDRVRLEEILRKASLVELARIREACEKLIDDEKDAFVWDEAEVYHDGERIQLKELRISPRHTTAKKAMQEPPVKMDPAVCVTCNNAPAIEPRVPWGKHECQECRKKRGKCKKCGVNRNDCCC